MHKNNIYIYAFLSSAFLALNGTQFKFNKLGQNGRKAAKRSQVCRSQRSQLNIHGLV